MSNIFRKQGVNTGGGGSGSANIQEIDYATFDQKSQAEKDNGTLWLIPDVPVMPNGRTATPNDVQTWLACANITDKAYTTVSQVLADTTTLTSLINDNNASDYMARSTTWATTICADQTAMTLIGANNYCADVVLANSTWLNAIADSVYMESVLNVKVPTMTSNTTPSGVASANSETFGPAFYAFDGDDSTYFATNNWTAKDSWIKYDFNKGVIIKKVHLYPGYYPQYGGINMKDVLIQASNDDINWTTLVSYSFDNVDASVDVIVPNSNSYRYYRVYETTDVYMSNQSFGCKTLQFYGREDV